MRAAMGWSRGGARRLLARAREGFCVRRGEGTWSGQCIQIPSVLNLLWDDILAGDPGDGPAQIGSQEVMNGPFPAAHAGADGFLLRKCRAAFACVTLCKVR